MAQSVITQIRPKIDFIVALVEQGIEVLPGQETAVSIDLRGIPANAKFTRITGKIQLWKSSSAAEFAVTGKISKPDSSAGDVSNSLAVTSKKAPEIRNLKVRLTDGEVFWVQPGPLAIGATGTTYALPDFTAEANKSLEDHPPQEDKLQLTFLVQSDTPARVEIDIGTSDFEIALLQTQTWANELDDTLRFDRNLALDFCAIQTLDLDAAQSTDYPRLESVRLDLTGQSGGPRVLSSIETHDDREFAIVSSQFSIAQEARPAFPLQCTGISACVRATSEAELYLELRDDLPSGSSRADPKGKASVKLTSSDNSVPTWVYVPLEKEITLDTARTCWVILRAIQGVIYLATVSGSTTNSITPASSETPPTKDQEALRLLVNRGGQRWKPFSRQADGPSALLRLIYLPDADHQTAAVELQLQLGSSIARSQSADISMPPQAIHFDLANDNVRLRAGEKPQLLIKSHMRGELTIANLIQEFAK